MSKELVKTQTAVGKFISRVKNFGMMLPNMKGVKGMPENLPAIKDDAHDPRSFMVPLQLLRIRQDVITWRGGVEEAENAFYPHRFKMQQMFVDTILEGHTLACMEKRKRLTLQKEFCIGKRNSEGIWQKNEESTKIFQNKRWFKHLTGYLLDKKFYGYSLIQLGDLVIQNKDYRFDNLTIIKRWNVSPDRKQFVQIPYQTWGINLQTKVYQAHDQKNAISFSEDVDENGVPYNDWMIYVDTPSDIGSSICGWGLLYNATLYSIILRNNLSHNADYTQMFAAPYRHIKTPAKYGSAEYNALEKSAAEMGGFGYLLTSDQETVDFVTGNNGTGFQSYADLEKRCQQMLSKIILGHADAIDSHARSLGGGTGGQKSLDEDSTPEGKALAEVEKEDTDDILNDLNDICLPKFRNLGIPIAEDEMFYVTNDKEEFENRKKEDAANAVTATIAQTMKSAGLQMSAEYFEDRTGIPAEKIEEPVAPPAPSFGKNIKAIRRIENKLNKIYHA
jgi:hypothetical protein